MTPWIPSAGRPRSALRSPRARLRILATLGAWVLALILPALVPAASSSFYPSSKKEAGALKLAQVMGIASRDNIVGLKKDHQRLLDSGLPDSALVDRSVGSGRVYCCGGLPAATQLDALLFYIPPGISLELGDIVEIRLGEEPGKGRAGRINVVTQVRERANATERHCRWEPPRASYPETEPTAAMLRVAVF